MAVRVFKYSFGVRAVSNSSLKITFLNQVSGMLPPCSCVYLYLSLAVLVSTLGNHTMRLRICDAESKM